ncbi:MAG: hypothetical protein KAT62_10150 [Desulfuromonadales bacterium]|nr:hypothetical protein [Desulfuromonadales bacterium]
MDKALPQMETDCFDAAANVTEMGGGACGDDAATIGAAIALHIEAGRKTVEIPGNESMSPYPRTLTPQAGFRAFPGVIAAEIKNRLETDSNMPYHDDHVLFRGVYPEERRAESSVKLSARFFINIPKEPSTGLQIIWQHEDSCQSNLKRLPSASSVYCGN